MKTKNILWKLTVLSAFIAFSHNTFAQDAATGPDRRPVKEVFNSSLLIDQQTNISPYKGGLELIIHHRLGTMENGFKDLAGIYGSSNIRLGFNYGITEKLSIGIGTERMNKFQDLYAKYLILQQKRTGMPISLSFLTQVGLDARNKEVFQKSYSFTNRLSFFNELIVSRKFSSKLSLQVAPSYIHFNAVESDSTKWNDYFGISVGGRFKFYNEMSIIATYDQGFAIMPNLSASSRAVREEVLVAPKPSLGLGLEIGTPTHCFMVFVSNSYDIIQQKNLAYNKYSVSDGAKGLRVGFDLTVRF
ncbi:MAG: DUF5777 family beta-barrel protein [Bacteroidia bacterium]|nr:DUF5777 family beta-barrel protein [Bacteroidia bacterium]